MHEGLQRQQWDHTASLMWMLTSSRTATPATFHPFARDDNVVLLEPGQAAQLRAAGTPVRRMKAAPKQTKESSDGKQ